MSTNPRAVFMQVSRSCAKAAQWRANDIVPPRYTLPMIVLRHSLFAIHRSLFARKAGDETPFARLQSLPQSSVPALSIEGQLSEATVGATHMTAQHAAEGGVLGMEWENTAESRSDGTAQPASRLRLIPVGLILSI